MNEAIECLMARHRQITEYLSTLNNGDPRGHGKDLRKRLLDVQQALALLRSAARSNGFALRPNSPWAKPLSSQDLEILCSVIPS